MKKSVYRCLSLLLAVIMTVGILPSPTHAYFDEDIQKCEFCDHYHTAIERCPNCGGCSLECDQAGSWDCWSEHHCGNCGSCGNEICMECHLCEDCYDSVGDGYHCNECGKCWADDFENTEHCKYCGNCRDCSAHCCLICGACDNCRDVCYYCGVCEDCLAEADYHCQICGGCPDEFGTCIDDTHASHCANCCDICEQCGRCLITADIDRCPDCGLCVECCEENSRATDCTCGICVMSAEWEEHICEQCGTPFCQTEQCEFCGLCADCCQANTDYDICVMHPDYDAGFCPDCGQSLAQTEVCPFCGRCLDCCRSESGSDICLDDPAYEESFCPQCGELYEQAGGRCSTCGLCFSCCQLNSACSRNLCVQDPGYDMHICMDCGRCFHDSPACENCLLHGQPRCEACCLAVREELGCSCSDRCCSDPDFWEHIEGFHEGGNFHTAKPQSVWSVDDDCHWKQCRFCDSPEHVFSKMPHTFNRFGVCTECGFHRDGRVYISRQPTDVSCRVSDETASPDSPYYFANNKAVFSVQLGNTEGKEISYNWFLTQGPTEDEFDLQFPYTLKDLDWGTEDTVLIAEGAGTARLRISVPFDGCTDEYRYLFCQISVREADGTTYDLTTNRVRFKTRHVFSHGDSVREKDPDTGKDKIKLAFTDIHGFKNICYFSEGHYPTCCSTDCTAKRNHIEPHHYRFTREIVSKEPGFVYNEYVCEVCGHTDYIRKHKHLFLDQPGVLKSPEYEKYGSIMRGPGDGTTPPEDTWIDYENSTKDYHILRCLYPGCPETKIARHDWGRIQVVDTPTDTGNGGMWRECKHCGYQDTDIHLTAPDGTPIRWTNDQAVVVCNEPVSLPLVSPGDPLTVRNVSHLADQKLDPDGWTITYELFDAETGLTETKDYTAQMPMTRQSNGSYRGVVPDFLTDVGGGGKLHIRYKRIPCRHENGTRKVHAFEQLCDRPGYTGDEVCVDCGKLVTQGREIPAPLNAKHQGPLKLIPGTAYPGSCIQSGYEGTFICETCGAKVAGKHTSRVHGTTEIRDAIPFTCTKDGYSGDEYCTKCGKLAKRGRPIPAHHPEDQIILTGAVEPTCTTPGYSGDRYCGACNQLISKGFLIPVTEHVFGEWEIVKASFGNQTGIKHRFCQVCGYEDRKIDLNIHSLPHILELQECGIVGGGPEEGIVEQFGLASAKVYHTAEVTLEYYADTLEDGRVFTGKWDCTPPQPAGWYRVHPDEPSMIIFSMPDHDLKVYPIFGTDQRTEVHDLKLDLPITEAYPDDLAGSDSITAKVLSPQGITGGTFHGSWKKWDEQTGHFQSQSVFTPGFWHYECYGDLNMPDNLVLASPIAVTVNGEPWFLTEYSGSRITSGYDRISLVSPTIELKSTGSPLVPNRYSVTFCGGPYSYFTSSVLTGANGRLPSIPAAPESNSGAYTFAGWFTEPVNGDPVTKSTVFRQDTLVYAHWTKSTYRLTLNANGGTGVPASVQTDEGGIIGSELPVPQYAGFSFAGWFTEASGGIEIRPGTSVWQDLTLYAHWDKIPLNFTQQPGDVSSSAQTALTVRFTVDRQPSRTALVFADNKPALVLDGVTAGVPYAASVPADYGEAQLSCRIAADFGGQTYYSDWFILTWSAQTYPITVENGEAYFAHNGQVITSARPGEVIDLRGIRPADPGVRFYRWELLEGSAKPAKVYTMDEEKGSALVMPCGPLKLHAVYCEQVTLTVDLNGAKPGPNFRATMRRPFGEAYKVPRLWNSESGVPDSFAVVPEGRTFKGIWINNKLCAPGSLSEPITRDTVLRYCWGVDANTYTLRIKTQPVGIGKNWNFDVFPLADDDGAFKDNMTFRADMELSWLCGDDFRTAVPMTDETFQANKQYIAKIVFTAKEGFSLHKALSVTVNGHRPGPGSGFQGRNYVAYIYYDFTEWLLTGAIRSMMPDVPTTISLLQNGETVFSTELVGDPPAGQDFKGFQLRALKGTYDLVITKPGHLSYTIKNLVVDGVLHLMDSLQEYRIITLPAGDVNGDGTINVSDLNTIWNASNYNKSAADAQPLTDLNGDGTVNVSDLNAIWNASNYNKSPIVVEYVPPRRK